MKQVLRYAAIAALVAIWILILVTPIDVPPWGRF